MPKKTKLYSVSVDVAATAYVRATSQKAAYAKAKHALKEQALEVRSTGAGVIVSGAPYAVLLDSTELPDVTLSPAMTILSVTGPVERAG